MIIKANRHNNGAKLARYMKTGNVKKGERAELGELRGFASDNILDAFRDVEIMAQATKAENALFHVQVRLPEGEKITREQWYITADRIEKRLGLTGQPRALYFHVNELTGEEHIHVGWSLIDEEAMKAKPVPFFKFRLKALARELEEEFDITRVKNEREGPIKYAAKKNEQQQAQRLAVDKDEIRNTIRACWEQSDCGRSFEGALAHAGMILAQGDQRGLVVVDHAGGVHAIGKRLLDVNKKAILERISDLDLSELPAVQPAQSIIREMNAEQTQEPRQENQQSAPEKQSEPWDRDRANQEWEDAVMNAAIENEKTARQFVEAKPEKEEPRAGKGQARSDGEKQIPKQQEQPAPGRAEKEQQPDIAPAIPEDLRGTAAQIWTAKHIADDARAFAAALAASGLHVAIVHETDRPASPAPRDEREQLAALTSMKKNGVWMMAEGGVSELTDKQRDSAERSYDNYRQQREEADKSALDFHGYVAFIQDKNAGRLAELTARFPEGPPRTENKPQHAAIYARAGTFVVINERGYLYHLNERTTGAKSADMQNFMATLDARQVPSVAATRQMIEEKAPYKQRQGEYVSYAETLILGARRAAMLDERAKEGDPIPNAKAFADALEQKGIAFALVTPDESYRSHRENAFARAVGRKSDYFEPGEIVVVTEPRLERLRAGEWIEPPRVHKLDPDQAEQYLTFLSLDKSKLKGIDATKSILDGRADDRAAYWRDIRLERATDLKDFSWTRGGKLVKTAVDVMETAPRAINAAFNAGMEIAGAFFSAIDTPKSPRLQERENREGERATDQRNAEAEQKIDFSKYTGDRAQERRNEQDQQAARDRQREIERDR